MKKLISWVEIPTANFERAVKFYNSVFDIELLIIDCGQEKMACFPNGEGAISHAPNFKPSKDGLLVSFNVSDDIESSIERIKTNGGTIIQPKCAIKIYFKRWS